MKKIIAILTMLVLLSTAVSAQFFDPFVFVDDRTDSESFERSTSFRRSNSNFNENRFVNSRFDGGFGGFFGRPESRFSESFSRSQSDFFETEDTFERFDRFNRNLRPNFGPSFDRFNGISFGGGPYRRHDPFMYDNYGHYRNPYRAGFDRFGYSPYNVYY